MLFGGRGFQRSRPFSFDMRLLGLPLIFLASLGLAGCADSLSSQPLPSKWTMGFWYWHGNRARPAIASEVPDVLFVHAGTIVKYGRRDGAGRWQVSGEFPDSLPAARDYWLVFREEQAGVPDVSVAPILADRVSRLLVTARQRKLRVVGVQHSRDMGTSCGLCEKSCPRASKYPLPRCSIGSATGPPSRT
jgi:hypothetical protein